MSSSGECCYLCNECSLSFTSLPDLELHLANHAKFKEDSQTQQCSADVMEEDDASSQHSPSSSNDSEKGEEGAPKDSSASPPTCRTCHARFDDRQQLRVHLMEVHGERSPYSCATCGEVFHIKRELATHMRLHAGEQPHGCTQCGKQFGTRQLLKKHCMWHTGERSHVCPTCKKAFFQKGHLTQHLMIHAGGRPHQCSLCQKTFIFKFDLNRHMKIHAERGFTCQLCSRSFLKQSSLDEHKPKCKGGAVSITNGTRPSLAQHSASSPSTFSPSKPDFPSLQIKSEPESPHRPLPCMPVPTIIPNLTKDDILRMAQSVVAQSQSTTVSTTSPFAALSSEGNQFCFLCSRQFPSSAAFALHISMVHFPPSSVACTLPCSIAQQSKNPEESSIKEITPSSSFTFSSVKALKTEEVCGTDSATNSSCASSPQKASPSGGSVSPAVDVSTTPPHSTTPTCAPKCTQCEESSARISELQAALLSSTTQLNSLKQLLTTNYCPPVSHVESSPIPALIQSLSVMQRSPLYTHLQSLLVNMQ